VSLGVFKEDLGEIREGQHVIKLTPTLQKYDNVEWDAADMQVDQLDELWRRRRHIELILPAHAIIKIRL